MNGTIAGLVGFVVFLAIHAAWIVPIWSIAPEGAAAAALGGAAVGGAYAIHRARLPRGRMTRVATVFAAGVCVLLLSIPVAFVLFPGQRDFASVPAMKGVAALGAFLSLATFVGGIGGWLAAHSWRTAAVTALAFTAFGAGIGHNAPILAAGPVALKMWTIMVVATGAASVTLVYLERPDGHVGVARTEGSTDAASSGRFPQQATHQDLEIPNTKSPRSGTT